jgi:hypothetical protein
MKTGRTRSKEFLSRTSASFGKWAFVRQYEPCDCPRRPQSPDFPIHARHLKGGANLIPGARKWQYIVAELTGAFAIIHGIGFWSVPSAWIVAGLAIVVSVEVRS